MSRDWRFSEARLKVLSEAEAAGGIGTLSEKLLHKILKFYFDPDPSHHEIPVLGSIADIMNESGITEIQTGSFQRLVPKLKKLLPHYRVTVVLPLVGARFVNYIDPETGELLTRRKSPRTDRINRAACELYKITELIPSANLDIRIEFIEFEDYRYKSDKKGRTVRRAQLIERIPSRIVNTVELSSVSDYSVFLPSELPREFSAKDLSRLTKLDSRRAHNTLSLLLGLGLIARRQGEGRSYIYEKRC